MFSAGARPPKPIAMKLWECRKMRKEFSHMEKVSRLKTNVKVSRILIVAIKKFAICLFQGRGETSWAIQPYYS